jgi:hypothetical protein
MDANPTIKPGNRNAQPEKFTTEARRTRRRRQIVATDETPTKTGCREKTTHREGAKDAKKVRKCWVFGVLPKN